MARTKPKPAPGPPHPAQPVTVSGRWLLGAFAITIPAAALCAWAVLCLLFWQGSWQLLYHPASAVTRTPAIAGLPFESVDFAVTAGGAPQMRGWWIPREQARYTAIYLHGADGNLGDTVDTLSALYGAGMSVFAIDYRGYGLSTFKRPSEAHWRQDAESAIEYLTQTRHIPAGSLVLIGRGLGANLALEAAAAHPELAGLVLDDPLPAPADTIFADPRAKLVPAHLLARDQWDADTPAASLRIPSLWFYRTTLPGEAEQKTREAYRLVTARKEQVWLTQSPDEMRTDYDALTRWLDDLHR
jgi:hypothetical protein